MVEGLATDAEGVRHIGEVDFRMTLQMLTQLIPKGFKSRFGAGGQDEQLNGSSFVRWLGLGRFFDHGVGIGTADAEGADAGSSR